MKRAITSIAIALLAVLGAFSAETNDVIVVVCNVKTNTWEARVSTARPGSTDYNISIRDYGQTSLRMNGSLAGEFEFMGHYHSAVSVRVSRKKFASNAYERIHALVKAGKACSLSVKGCTSYDEFVLVGAEFPDVGKYYELAKDGKVREVVAK